MTDELAANQPEQETAAPDKAESAPAADKAPVEQPKTDFEPDWAKKRFGELTARHYASERRAVAAEERAAKLEKELADSQLDREPIKTLADFNYDEAKRDEYLLDLAEKRSERAATRRRDEDERKANSERRDQKFNEKMHKFKTENPSDWELAATAPIDKQVVDALKDLDLGLEVAAFLGKNPDLAAPLNALSERQLAIQLGRLEERVDRDRAANKAALEAAKAAKAVSKAPEPPPQIDGTQAAVSADPEQLEGEAFTKWFRKRRGLK
jgi:hypothetical protein